MSVVAFNAAFGIKTNFAAVAEVDNQGRVVSGTANGASSSATQTSASTSTQATATTSATVSQYIEFNRNPRSIL